VGESGSGKSALLKTLAGHYFVSAGKITYGFYEQYRQEHSIKDPLFSHRNLMAYVDVKHDFKNLSNTSDFYYQQRFNAGYADNAQTVGDFLKDNAGSENPDSKWPLSRVYEIFNLEALRHKHLIKLSNGETKRLRIGTALLKNPKLLLLDNPLAGLDVETRAKFEDIFAAIAASGIAIVMTTSPFEIPKIITHVGALNKDRQLTACKKEAFIPAVQASAPSVMAEADNLDKLLNRKNRAYYNTLVSMRNVRVAYGETVIFDNINWEIRPGEHWALSGPNGSGKSTLLSLINGDHPQAYANEIVLFDRKRGSGETIWDIKKKIGFMSPELYQYFPHHYTCLQVVESGFYDTIGLFSPGKKKNREIAEQWMAVMHLSDIRSSHMYEVSTSRQRLCLLARAVVKNPYLLMLDEPCLGFDRRQQQDFKNLIDKMAELSDLTVIYVTHHQESLPACITKTLKLGES